MIFLLSKTEMRHNILLLHAFAQHSDYHIKEIKHILNITKVLLFDYIPIICHPYIK